jgi:hypothetical protein
VALGMCGMSLSPPGRWWGRRRCGPDAAHHGPWRTRPGRERTGRIRRPDGAPAPRPRRSRWLAPTWTLFITDTTSRPTRGSRRRRPDRGRSGVPNRGAGKPCAPRPRHRFVEEPLGVNAHVGPAAGRIRPRVVPCLGGLATTRTPWPVAPMAIRNRSISSPQFVEARHPLRGVGLRPVGQPPPLPGSVRVSRTSSPSPDPAESHGQP